MKRLHLVLLFLVVGVSVFAQGLVIRDLEITRGGVRRSLDDWWYDSDVECHSDAGEVDIAFCIDTSGSMSGAIDRLYMAVGNFAQRVDDMGADARFGLLNYCETIGFPHGHVLLDYVTFRDVLGTVTAAEGAIEQHWLAVHDAHENFLWRPGSRRIIILVTDECDEPSGWPERHDVEPLLLASETRLYCIMATSGPFGGSCDYAQFEAVCETTGGMFFDYGEYELDDVFPYISMDLVDFFAISIDVQNTSGGVLDPIHAEIEPMPCIDLDTPAELTDGPIAHMGTASFTWDIEEIPHCHFFDYCFWIKVWSGSYRDSLVGCLFVRDCGCPGPEARIIEPPRCGIMTACADQPIIIELVSFLQINPATLILRVNGVDYDLTNPQLSWDPETQRLTFTPSPLWGHDMVVTFQLIEAEDVSGCELAYTEECWFHTDIRPPLPESVSWDPPCGSHITGTDIVRFSCTVYDEPAGMTMLDNTSSLDMIDDLWALIGSFTAVGIRFNGIPYIGFPGIGYRTITPIIGWPLGRMDTSSISDISDGTSPGPFSPIPEFRMTRTICISMTGYPPCGPEIWHVGLEVPGSTIQEWALGAASVEVCIDFRDLIPPSLCGPNDTSLCCIYHFPTGCIPGWAEIICPFPCGGFTSCDDQFMQFGIYDTMGVAIDTMRVYFTVEVHHEDGTVDTYSISEPSPYSWFEPIGDGSTVNAFVSMPWEDGDSVWISLDSFYTTGGCITIP